MSAVLPVYRRSNITITRGEGMYLIAADGRRYLDFASGIAVNALGHCHPHVVAALKEQADTLWHCSNLYRIPGLERLAERLVAASFADKVFFCNSGTEAVECGLKMVRKYFSSSPSPLVGEGGMGGNSPHAQASRPTRHPSHLNPPPRGGRKYRIITMEGGFHGRTLACISAGGNEVARKGYEPLLDGFDRGEFNNLKAVEKAITPETAAILVEPIQGEGGVRVATKEFLQGLRRLCDQHGLLLFLDEVQCGMGRTGALFAHQQMGIVPDIVTAAKGIGNGFPLAACLTTDKVAAAMTPGSHGSTYGSNPLAMAVGNAVLDVMLTPGFFEQVAMTGALLENGLQGLAKDYPHLIADVRGAGLMLGIQMRIDHRDFTEQLRGAGLLTAPTAEGGVIRIIPPLIVQREHIEEALRILRGVCEAYGRERYAS